MYHFIVAVAAFMVALPAAHAWGQNEDVLEQWYGSGVHAYFAGNNAQAEQALTQAIEGGTMDPRAHYFRALTYLKMGRSGEAEFDMAAGAAMEIRDLDGQYPVSRSLERIQGHHRQLLEGHRRQARSIAYQQRRTRERKRYEVLRRQEQDVLRRKVTIPLEQHAAPLENPPVPDRSTTDAGRPAAPEVKADGQEGTSVAVPAEKAPDAPETKPTAEDSFGAVQPEAPTEKAPASNAIPAETKEDGAKKEPADEDPFGEAQPKAADDKAPASEPKPAEKKDDGAKEEPADEDPFGEAQPKAADDKAPASEAKPAEKNEDEAKEEPAEKKEDEAKEEPAADDPFAGA